MSDNAKTVSDRPVSELLLSNIEFLHLRRLVEKRTGLRFSDERRREFQIKLSSMLTQGGGQSGYDLLKAVRTSDEALQSIINYLTIGESYFFRNKPHFDALTEQIFPRLILRASDRCALRIWCAGCSTGEEPYSISMLLRDRFPAIANWDVQILATDINTGFLECAKHGRYSKWSFRGCDEAVISRYFTMISPNKYQLNSEIIDSVTFSRFNLSEFPYDEHLGDVSFDLIMCRNVLIYFSFPLANKVIDSFSRVARPGSYLVVGHSEAFPTLSKLDAIYSNATYYYRYHEVAGENADRQSITPSPSLSIPGIGVKTVVPASDFHGSQRYSMAVPGLPVSEIMSKVPTHISEVAGTEESVISIVPPPEGSPEADSFDLDAALELARMQVNDGKISETLEQLRVLADGRGKLDHRVHFLLSIVADQAGRTSEAIQSLRQSIFLDKSFVIGHFFLGVVCQREGQLKGASRSFRNVNNLLDKLPIHHHLDEADGMTAGRLGEIAAARFKEVAFELT